MTAQRHREDHQDMVTVWSGAAKWAAFAILMIIAGGRSVPPGHSRAACRYPGALARIEKPHSKAVVPRTAGIVAPGGCCRCANK
jgi:hypothetical protein